MSEDNLPNLKGKFSKEGVIIDNEGAQNELKLRGYGEETDYGFILKDYEVLLLLYTEKLEILDKRRKISIDKMVNFSLSRDMQAWTRFLIYRDLRMRGYVVREGFGFGVDFRVYERGDFGTKSAKYIVFCLNEGIKTTIDEINKTVNQIKRMGKEAVLAVIERRGEVIYYKIQGWKPYFKNRNIF